jgi:hypothetical protein
VTVYYAQEDSNSQPLGIRLQWPNNEALNPNAGVISWWEGVILPGTDNVDPRAPIGAAETTALPYAPHETRVFYWDKDGGRICQAWWCDERWTGGRKNPFLEALDVPGRGMDAIVWFDPIEGLLWSCFYTDVQGTLYEATFYPKTERWAPLAVIAIIPPDSPIQAQVSWNQDECRCERGQHSFLLTLSHR